jgi:hypothetical protein
VTDPAPTSDQTRRLLSQAFFEAIYVCEDGIRAMRAEPFQTLLGVEVIDNAQP